MILSIKFYEGLAFSSCFTQKDGEPELNTRAMHLNLGTEAGSHISIVQLTIPQSTDALCKLIEKLDAIALS